MYAIVEIAGQQFKVEKNQKIFVHRINDKEGNKINFDNVLLIDNKGKINIGNPTVKGASVTAKILSHLKDDKVIVFKKKRRKGFQVKNGHRQHLTRIEIEKITEKNISATKKETQKKTNTIKKEAKTDTRKKATTKKTSSNTKKTK